MGMEPGRTVRRTDDGHRPAVIGVTGVDRLGDMPGGVGHVGTVHQNGPIHTLRPHLRTRPAQPIRSHAALIRRRRRDLIHRGAVAAHRITMPRSGFDREQPCATARAKLLRSAGKPLPGVELRIVERGWRRHRPSPSPSELAGEAGC